MAKVNIKEEMVKRDPFGSTGLWRMGTIQIGNEVFKYSVKTYQEGSEWGIEEGRISKLCIADETDKKTLVHFDRGWDREPSTESLKTALKLVKEKYN